MAIEYWSHFSPIRPVDLVVADVRFKDDTSPLASLVSLLSKRAPDAKDFWLPTGLGHLKGFAAIARATGSPIGIAVHTAEMSQWRDFIASEEPVLNTLAFIAAHEIGELAAMLGEGDKIRHDSRKLESCWEWLERNTKIDWIPAVFIALASFRQSLKGKNAPPEEWRRLAKWCDDMKREPKPLASNDCGLPLALGDNTQDRISFCSLFGDVEQKKSGFRFDLDLLPERCFNLESDANFFLLDNDHFPRIGSLIHELGSLNYAYEAALAILKAFPTPNEAFALGNSISALPGSQRGLASALAILLKSIEREHEIFEKWAEGYRDYKFDLKECRFESDSTEADKSKTLLGLVSACEKVLRQRRQDSLTADEIMDVLAERIDGLSAKSFQLALSILVSINIVASVETGGTIRLSDGNWAGGAAALIETAVPPVPVNDVKKSLMMPDILVGSPFQYLAVTFGGLRAHELYYKHKANRKDVNTNVIGREVANGFGFMRDRDKDEATIGRELLTRFWDGDATWFPGLNDICRLYVKEELGWDEAGSWPHWLHKIIGPR
jgi:hypothetical protein